jgi:hypothetical protein
MKHRRYVELIHLLVFDEISVEERTALDDHMSGCAECRREYEQVRELQDALRRSAADRMDSSLLQEAREQLRRALNRERYRTSPWRGVLNLLEVVISPRTGLVLGGALTLAAGIVIGRLGTPSQEAQVRSAVSGKAASGMFDERSEISNVRFLSVNHQDGTLEFTFDAITPVTMKGNITDPRIQEILARTMVTDRNPGVRLRSASMFASQVQRLKSPDKEVKRALIHALKNDSNPAVRKEALKTLRAFSFDDDVKQAFLYVLVHDMNPAMRIAAINSLDSARIQDLQGDKDLLEILKEKMHSDDNNYVRIKARSVLEEAKRP